MTFEEGLFDFLTNAQALLGILGSRPWLYPDFAKQNETLPLIIYSLEDDRSIETQSGPSILRHAIYRLDVWAEKAKDAMQVARAIRSALDGYKGAMGTLDYVSILFDGAGRSRDPDTMAINISMRFQIFYQENY